MKHVAAAVLVFALVFALASCGAALADGDGRPRVVATIFPQYDFVRAIAGDRVSLSMMISPGSESHTYEPSIADVAEVAGADLFIYTGGDVDPWAESLAETVEDADVTSIKITDATGGVHDHDHEHGHGDHDMGGADAEHSWTSPENAIKILYYIRDALTMIDPDGGELYRMNADAYAGRIAEIGEALSELAENSEGETVVVADRFPFGAMFEEYGIAHAEALGGCAVGEEPSADTIKALLELIEERDIKYVFYIEFSSRSVSRLLSEATGCGELLLHSCHNVSRDDFEAGVTYCDLMERNVRNLSEVLS